MPTEGAQQRVSASIEFTCRGRGAAATLEERALSGADRDVESWRLDGRNGKTRHAVVATDGNPMG